MAGISPNEEEQALAPTNLHVITGEVVGKSENGKTLVSMEGMVFTGDDSQYIEMDTLGGLEEGDIATILLSGESGKAMSPLALGSAGSIDRIISTVSEKIDLVDIEYAESESEIDPPEDGWSTYAPTWKEGYYIWQRTATYSNDTVSYSDPVCISGRDGQDGATGPQGPQGTPGEPGATGPQGPQGMQGETGPQGPAGTSVTVSKIEYGTSNSASAQPSSWSTTIPSSITKGMWLWVKTTYSDSSVATTKSYVGTDGEDGSSVYVQSATKSGDTTTVVIADTEGHTTTLSIVDGQDGSDGSPGTNGLNGYVHVAWATSADGSQGFSTTVSAGKTYLGTYTDNKAADSQIYSDYSWSLIKGETGATGPQGPQGIQGETGATGPQGPQGIQGETGATGPQGLQGIQGETGPQGSTGPQGVGVSAIVEQYYLSTSDSSQTGGSWSAAQPEWSEGKYIWTRSQVTWTNGNVTTTTPVLAKAINGANESASSAQGIAQQAKEVAEATGQHFWPDTDGVHVTEVTQDEWNDSTGSSYHSGANVLLNALGQLFRDGVNDLLALVAGTAHSETFTVESYVYDPTYSYMATHTIGVEHIAIQSVTFDGSEFPRFSATTRRGWVYKKSTNVLSLRFHQSDSARGKQVTVNYRTFASMAIYDGTGNDAENIAASFSADDIMLGGSIDGDVDDDKASIRFFGGSVDTETTYIDASGGIGTSSITGDPCYLNREIVLGNIVTDSRLYDDSGRRANGFVSFAQSISDSYNTAGETTSSYVDSYVSLYSGTNDVANYAAITAKSIDYLLDSTTSDTETYTEVSARADRIRLEDTSGEAIIPMEQAIAALQQPYAMFTGSSGTATSTANGWRITWFNTVHSHSPNWSDYFSFSNGVITAKRNIQLEISGCMNWTDSVAGNRGFGVFVNSSTVGSGTEFSEFQMFPNTVNSRKSVWMAGLVLSLDANVHCAVGRYENNGAVYVNGANFSRILLKVLGTF